MKDFFIIFKIITLHKSVHYKNIISLSSLIFIIKLEYASHKQLVNKIEMFY